MRCSSPLSFSAIVSSHPPTCAPPMNTLGTVRCPVISVSTLTSAFSSLNLSRSTARCVTSIVWNRALTLSQYGHQLLAHTTTSFDSILPLTRPVSRVISASETSTSPSLDAALVVTIVRRRASVGARETPRTWSARTRARRDAMRVTFIASAGAASADMCRGVLRVSRAVKQQRDFIFFWPQVSSGFGKRGFARRGVASRLDRVTTAVALRHDREMASATIRPLVRSMSDPSRPFIRGIPPRQAPRNLVIQPEIDRRLYPTP